MNVCAGVRIKGEVSTPKNYLENHCSKQSILKGKAQVCPTRKGHLYKWQGLSDHDPAKRLRSSANLVGSWKSHDAYFSLSLEMFQTAFCFIHLFCFPISSISYLPGPGNTVASIFMLVSIFQVLPKSLLFVRNYFEYLHHYNFSIYVPLPFMHCRYEMLQGFFVPALQDQLSKPVPWHFKQLTSLKNF